jgi:hypothetical protein
MNHALASFDVIQYQHPPKKLRQQDVLLKSKRDSMTTIRPTWPWAVAGLVLSCYALYVEHKVSHKEEDEIFTALCDIERLGASCRYVL